MEKGGVNNGVRYVYSYGCTVSWRVVIDIWDKIYDNTKRIREGEMREIGWGLWKEEAERIASLEPGRWEIGLKTGGKSEGRDWWVQENEHNPGARSGAIKRSGAQAHEG